jgi:hypothetical protein
MIALKSFGLDYRPSADYYKQILPGKEDFAAALQKEQKARGYEMPDYYLSKEYVMKVYQEEMEKQLALEAEKNREVMHLLANHQLFIMTQSMHKNQYSPSDLFGDQQWNQDIADLKQSSINHIREQRVAKRSKKVTQNVKYTLNFKTGAYEPISLPDLPLYKGSRKKSVSLLPSTGKITPYVEEEYPHSNRVGLLLDSNECEFKSDKFVFRKDANTFGQKNWKKIYKEEDIQKADFEDRLRIDSEAAMRNSEKVGHVSMDELVEQLETNKDQFAPYNEILASVKGSSVKGVFVFSKGLPLNLDVKIDFNDPRELSEWPPLHAESNTIFQADEDYDRYMLLLGIGKRIMTRNELGVDVPLYEINETSNKDLSLISTEQQRALINEILNDERKLDGIVRIIKHQSDIQEGSELIKENLKKQLSDYANTFYI